MAETSLQEHLIYLSIRTDESYQQTAPPYLSSSPDFGASECLHLGRPEKY
jgi:hypothetical protein